MIQKPEEPSISRQQPPNLLQNALKNITPESISAATRNLPQAAQDSLRQTGITTENVQRALDSLMQNPDLLQSLRAVSNQVNFNSAQSTASGSSASAGFNQGGFSGGGNVGGYNQYNNYQW